MQIEPDLRGIMGFGGDITKKCQPLARISLAKAQSFAQQHAAWGGHTLRPWKRERISQGDIPRLTTSCRACGLWLQACSKPIVADQYYWGSLRGWKCKEAQRKWAKTQP